MHLSKRRSIVFLMVACMLMFALQGIGIAPQEVQAAAKPNVVILATGGTIAGAGDSETQTSGYTAGVIGVETLINAVPQMKEIANITGEQIANIDSSAMNDEVWLTLAKRVNQLLASPDINGVVITHGTDTLEETAYFLNLVVKSEKPVVLVGAMRPATAMSADGPLNIYNAVTLAACPEAAGKGVFACMNDTFTNAREVTKTNTANVSAFKNPELGYSGYIQNGEVYFYSETVKRHTVDSQFDVSDLTSLPRVEIIYSHENDSRIFADAAVAAGAKGIIHAGTGNGSIYPETKDGLKDAVKQGVKVVRATRVPNGVVDHLPQDDADRFITSDNLNPQKARILLMLALTQTDDVDEIQQMFYEY